MVVIMKVNSRTINLMGKGSGYSGKRDKLAMS